MSRKQELFFIVAIALVLIAPYLYSFLISTYYIPGVDETYQLQGAMELFTTGRYVSIRDFAGGDLSTPPYTYINAWPIGYSFIISWLLKVGFTISSAAKIFQLTASLVGLCTWCFLGHKLIKTFQLRVLFVCVVILQYLAWGIYSTMAASWALTPLLTLAALWLKDNYTLNLKFLDQKNLLVIGACSILTTLLILFRFQNVCFIPTLVLWFYLIYRHNFQRFIKSSLLYSVLPIATYESIAYFNKLHSGYSSFVTKHFKFDLTWDWRWPLDILKAFFLGAFRLDDALSAVTKLYHLSEFSNAIANSVTVVITFISVCYCYKRFKNEDAFRKTFLWFVACATPLVGMLLALAIFLNYLNLPIGRYYHFLLTLFILSVFAGFSSANKRSNTNKWRIRFLVALLFVTSGSIAVYSKYRLQLSKDFDQKSATVVREVNRIQEANKGLPSFIITDHLFGTFVVKDYFPVYGSSQTDEIFKGFDVFFSKETLLFIITDRQPLKPQYETLSDLENISRHYSMTKLTFGSIDIYWRKFSVGKLKDQGIN